MKQRGGATTQPRYCNTGTVEAPVKSDLSTCPTPAVKFNNLDDVYNAIGEDSRALFTTKQANKIINSLKICDPAVGSGHFLVSALNEIIAVKNDLGVLLDREGKRLKQYYFEVVNDELVITDEDGELFEYHPTHKESQRVQEALFHEKQTIIENCLFGVDINPNSVKICRLRLWIELLKNAYYKNNDELETLPNIDINIKCGNSLISRYALDIDLKQILKKKRWTIDTYRIAVHNYRNSKSKEEKHDMVRLITDIKNDFKSEITRNDPLQIKLQKLQYEYNILVAPNIFKNSDTVEEPQEIYGNKENKKKAEKRKNELEAQIEKNTKEIEDTKNNIIYDNAFEWRFEFPEVLNDEGDFIGFDVVIGNPPYGLFNKKQNQKIALKTDSQSIEYLKNKYPEATGGVINAARIFSAFSFTISSNFGFQCMIIPYGILTDTTSVKLRKHVLFNHSLLKVDAFPERDSVSKRVFEDVKMSTSILLTSKEKSDNSFDIGISYERKINIINRAIFNSHDLIKLSPDLIQIPLTDTKSFKLLVKIYNKKDVIKLGSLTSCLTGEVDMTFGKAALSNKTTDEILLKGVQIDRFIKKTKKEEISQGKIEYVNIEKIKKIISQKKLLDSKQKRIALQGLTGVNEVRRLKATIINQGMFLANSCNYLLEPKNCQLELILSWLNTKLLNFIFKSMSTSSNVNGYEVDNLPFCFSKFDKELISLIKSILLKKGEDIYADTSVPESKIDQLMYKIFNLNEEEIKIVEENTK